MRRVLGAGLAVLVVLGALAGGAYYGKQVYEAPGPLATPRNVVVPRGSLGQIAGALREAGVIETPLAFRAAATLTRLQGPLRAAELAFPERASLREVLLVLRTARPVQHLVTIPEGLAAVQIAQILNGAEAASGSVPPPPEGEVLPETYAYELNTPRAAILERARAAMDKALRQVWEQRAPGLPLASPRDALILASIVERETGRAEERPRVAAVFLNRLRLGMKLQSDPTVAYGASDGAGSLDRKLTRADLERDDPYNTYRNPGLPPGPICSPGLASLRAATQPAASDDLYFVADGGGGHSFARTLDEHQRNVARYRALPDEAVPPHKR